jgi:hypothetical protein
MKKSFPGHKVKLEYLPVPGVKLAGELPRELQVVSDFIRYRSGPRARDRLAQAGYSRSE